MKTSKLISFLLVVLMVAQQLIAQSQNAVSEVNEVAKEIKILTEKIRKAKKGKIEKDSSIKVGLVLSGGGAKGFAHIAVIKAIEEAGVRIDYIGGTSMGAMVGGVYAAGYNPKQLDSIFNKLDFDKILYDYMPRSAQTFYEKDKRERYAVSFPIREGRVGMPQGVSKGYNLYSLMTQLTTPVRDIYEFKDLPTPFLCMATNVVTGEQVILERGNLAEAIIASGALPMLYAPVEVDEKLLTDGGVVNNFPVDEIRNKGMDIIIGVDIQAPLKRRHELQTGFDVMGQITSYKSVGDMLEKIKRTDIYINPNVSPYDAVSFSKGRAIIDSGAVAAQKVMPKLQALAYLQKGKERAGQQKVVDSLNVANITFVGNQKYTSQYLRGKLGFHWTDRISFNQLSTGALNLMATNNFSSVRYQVCPTPYGDEIGFHVKEKKESLYMRLSARYDNLYRTSLMLGLVKEHFLQHNDQLVLDIVASNDFRYLASYHVDNGYYTSYGAKSYLDAFTHDAPLTKTFLGQEVMVKFRSMFNQAYLQSIWRKKLLVGAGLEHRRFVAKSGSLLFKQEDFASVYAYLRFDTLDDYIMPTKGLLVEGWGNWYLHQWQRDVPFSPFVLTWFNVQGAIPFTQRLSVSLGSELGFHLGTPTSPMLNFIHGGSGVKLSPNHINMLGYDYLSFSSYDYIKLKVRLSFQLITNTYLNVQTHLMNAQDNLFTLKYDLYNLQQTGYGIGIASRQLFGPIEFSYSYSPEVKKHLLHVSLGYRF